MLCAKKLNLLVAGDARDANHALQFSKSGDNCKEMMGVFDVNVE